MDGFIYFGLVEEKDDTNILYSGSYEFYNNLNNLGPIVANIEDASGYYYIKALFVPSSTGNTAWVGGTIKIIGQM